MTLIDGNATLAGLVTARPALAVALDRAGLDYCCGGRRTLSDAVAAAGLDLDTVVASLTDLAEVDPVAGADAWTAMPPRSLVDHLEATHHAYFAWGAPQSDSAGRQSGIGPR